MREISASKLRRRADEARAIADEMRDPTAKRIMWNLTARYDLLARYAEAREDRQINSEKGDEKPKDRAA